MAIAGGTVVVSAYRDDDGGSSSGSVYIFHTSDDGATYDEVAKLTASDAAAYDEFGCSVAIDGGTVVVGASYKSSVEAQSTSSARATAAPRTMN